MSHRSNVSQIKLSTKSFGAGCGRGCSARHNIRARASLTAADLSDVIAGASSLLLFSTHSLLGGKFAPEVTASDTGRPESEALAALKVMAEALAGVLIKKPKPER